MNFECVWTFKLAVNWCDRFHSQDHTNRAMRSGNYEKENPDGYLISYQLDYSRDIYNLVVNRYQDITKEANGKQDRPAIAMTGNFFCLVCCLEAELASGRLFLTIPYYPRMMHTIIASKYLWYLVNCTKKTKNFSKKRGNPGDAQLVSYYF